MRLRFVTHLLCLWLGVNGALAGCSSESAEEEPAQEEIDSPEVPAPGTMAIDLTVSSSIEDLSDDAAFKLQGSRGLNYIKGMLSVAAVNLNVAVALGTPVRFLREAQSASAELVAQDSYVWSYDFTAGGVAWTGNLTGVRSPSEDTAYSWTMNVTREPIDVNECCDDFTYFTGETNGDGVGTWQLFDPRDSTGETNLFAITYDISDQDLKELEFEINSDRSADEDFGQGSTITYQATDATISLIIKNSVNAGAATTVEWDRATKAGSIESTTGDTDCWDSEDNMFVDKDC